jgi:hypothetical protein
MDKKRYLRPVGLSLISAPSMYDEHKKLYFTANLMTHKKRGDWKDMIYACPETTQHNPPLSSIDLNCTVESKVT